MSNSADLDRISDLDIDNKPLDNTAWVLTPMRMSPLTDAQWIFYFNLLSNAAMGMQSSLTWSSHFCKPCQYSQFHAVRVWSLIAVILAVTEELIVIQLWWNLSLISSWMTRFEAQEIPIKFLFQTTKVQERHLKFSKAMIMRWSRHLGQLLHKTVQFQMFPRKCWDNFLIFFKFSRLWSQNRKTWCPGRKI